MKALKRYDTCLLWSEAFIAKLDKLNKPNLSQFSCSRVGIELCSFVAWVVGSNLALVRFIFQGFWYRVWA